ncbi:pilus assembly protein TadG-related protein [Brevundimonas sp.]|uniref:pilus assembly protein TadG-related protein n=1 Tax=Brevundimonas sp. TaxID=1871086 RepID=UPI003D11400A
MTIVNRGMRRLREFVRGFAGDRRGNIAMISAFVIPVLLLITFGGIDIHRASTVKANLQDALDAATLAAARSQYTADADITRVGLASLRANLAPYQDITLLTGQTTFVLDNTGAVVGDAKVNVAALVANIILPMVGRGTGDQIPVGAHSEVVRSSQNVEVALVLDTTGSMAGTKIADLKLAAKDLVDIVVQDDQSPWYTKVSLVPYSMAVNPGAAAASSARGSVTGPRTISAISWSTGAATRITAATRANPVVISATGHGLANGDKVAIWNQSGMTQLNGRVFTVSNRSANSFSLQGVDGRNYSTFVNNNSQRTYVAKCARTDCFPTVTANGHALPNNGYVRIDGLAGPSPTPNPAEIGGMQKLNGETFTAGYLTANTFTINTVGGGIYTSGGQSWCAQSGCQWYAFTNADGDLTTHEISTCVTERSGSNAYTDASPSTTYLGRNYPSTSNPCLSNLIRPLSSDRAAVKSQIDALTASGSTGGHIGVGWGWYTVSPNFNSLWSGSGAGAYNRDTLKAVVVMTDGEYNSAYCNGVISLDSTTGSGATSTHIDCNAPNGHPFDQTQALCRAMKAAGVIVYTVGFQVVNDQRARDLVNGCATDAQHVYMPTSGSDLRQSFQAIGRDIASLRISR